MIALWRFIDRDQVTQSVEGKIADYLLGARTLYHDLAGNDALSEPHTPGPFSDAHSPEQGEQTISEQFALEYDKPHTPKQFPG